MIEIRVSGVWLTRGFWALVAANVLLLLASFASNYLYRVVLGGEWDSGGAWIYFTNQLHLGTENVLASWYSSSLLLLVSLGAFLCFVVDREFDEVDHPWLSWGWIVLALCFLLLSADEVGSLHERFRALPEDHSLGGGLGGWTDPILAPIVAVAVFLVMFGLVRLRTAPRAFVYLALGVGLFALNPLLETTEHSIKPGENGEGWLVHGLVYHFEEGTEIFGSLFFLAAMGSFLIHKLAKSGGVGGDEREGESSFELPAETAWSGSIAFFWIIAGGWALIEATDFDGYGGDRGIPQNWFAGAVATVVACAATLLKRTLRASEGRRRWSLLLLPSCFWFLGFYYGGFLQGWLGSSDTKHLGIGVALDWTLIGVLPIVTFGLWPLTRGYLSRIGFIAWIALFVIGVLPNDSSSVTLAEVAAMAVLLLVLIQLILERQRPPVSALG
jgi:hypothetical protein